VADRFCGNCGQELSLGDSFCPSCGRAVHEVARVSTPEADVVVRSPPSQSRHSEAPSTVQNKSTGGWGRMARLTAWLVGIVVVLAILGTLSNLGGGTGTSSSGGGADREAQRSGKTFTNGNYSELYSDPDAHEGASVDVAGQLLERPEDNGEELAFQMFADPENSEWNTIVYTDQTDLDLGMDDYVRVQGEVLGTFEGENAFGASLTTPSVQASKVSTVSAGQAIDPATEVREVGQTLGDQGFEVTLDKIEFGEESTRAYVKMANNTGRGASFFTFDAKIQQGSTQVDYLEDSYAYYEEEPQSELRPGVETEGVLAFESVDPNEPFELIVPWSSDNYNINPRDIVFQITP